jgi:hypothetical protein
MERVGGPGARASGHFQRGAGGKRPRDAPSPANAAPACADAPQTETPPDSRTTARPRAAPGPVWPSAQLAGVTAQGAQCLARTRGLERSVHAVTHPRRRSCDR